MLTNSNGFLGRTLGTCTLRRLIGQGGMGAVYLAQQSRPRRTVAVKVLLPHLIEARPREEFLTRFRREADAIAALDHINIMPIYEYGEQGDLAYLVMPYVMGGTLRERLATQPIPPIQDLISIVDQVAAGLDCAHALGIIHRDLKPGNILFHADGRILITDFGLAKMLKDVAEQDSGARALTSAGSIIGTPEYLSPEQGTGIPTDYHTDVYSLGVVIYQMLAGRVPFIGTTPVAVAIKHAIEEPPLITRFNPAIPQSVEAVVMKALAKAPEQRFPSAGELARALRRAIANDSVTVTWKAPDTKYPAVPTDSSQPKQASSKQEGILPDAQTSGDVTFASIDNQVTTHQNIENEVALEATHMIEETTPEKPTALPTLLMPPDMNESHTSPAQETLTTGTSDDVLQSSPTLVTPMEATQEDKFKPQALQQAAEVPALLPETEQPQYSPAPAKNRPEKRIQNQPVVLHTSATPPQRLRARFQPVRVILVGILLALLIIGGGLAVNQHWLLTQSASPTSNSEATATAISNGSKTPPSQQTPLPATTPQAAIPAGPLLYSTPYPFSACDKRGGHWTDTTNASVTCNSNGSTMVNQSGHLVIANLDQLTGNQHPWPSQSFIVQVQVTINPHSQGAFGIDFQSPASDNSQGYFAYLISPSGNRTFNHYDAQGHITDTFVSAPPPPPVSTKLTLDIRVDGTNYAFYINGVNTRDQAEAGPQYINKIVGLAVDTNADVTFSNLVIYAP